PGAIRWARGPVLIDPFVRDWGITTYGPRGLIDAGTDVSSRERRDSSATAERKPAAKPRRRNHWALLCSQPTLWPASTWWTANVVLSGHSGSYARQRSDASSDAAPLPSNSHRR